MTQTINVYLDDRRPCPGGFVLASTADECLTLLETCSVNILSLDHDLGWDQPSGSDLVDMMIERALFANETYIHTSSPTGRSYMFQQLYKRKPEGVKVYSHAMPDELLERLAKGDG